MASQAIRGAGACDVSVRLRLAAQHGVHDGRHTVPGLSFLGELAPAGRRERVEPRLAIVLSGAPGAAQQSTLFQAHQRGVQRAHIELKGASRDLLETGGYRVAMLWSEGIQGLKDHHVQRALQDVCLGLRSIRHANGISLVHLVVKWTGKRRRA